VQFLKTDDMSTDKGPKYLESLQIQQPALAARITQFADFYQRKLWHQLTVSIEESLALPEFSSPHVLIPFYREFVTGFSHKLNQLRLAQIAVKVAEQHATPHEAGEWGPRIKPLHRAVITCRDCLQLS
jgi:26S proteasome regulatory subunit N9